MWHRVDKKAKPALVPNFFALEPGLIIGNQWVMNGLTPTKKKSEQ